ncbi:MAG: site-2 protease family protein [Candidatus Gagatemarchaeaceae archaeon]
MSSEDFKRVEVSRYGIVLLRTRRFKGVMDRLGRNKIAKPVGWVLLYLMPIAAAFGFFIFISNFLVLFSPVAHQAAGVVRGISPLAYLGLPGINPYIPFLYGWIALVFGMIVHEGAHGVVSRSLGLPVKASGLLFFLFVPIGAFVDIDETALKAARARDSGRVLAAGAGVNFVAGIVFLLLLSNTVSTMSPAANGLAITGVGSPSPAATAGIHPGDFILSVNGVHLNDTSQIVNSNWYKQNQTITMTVWRSGEVRTVGLTVGRNPANASLPYLGINSIGYSELRGIASRYSNSFLTRPVIYICIPAFPCAASIIPFSDTLAPLYTSPYGGALVPLASLLYWLFFLNFNLAIFNALPIYPLDGGQAFRIGLGALGRGKLSEKTLSNLSTVATLVVFALIVTFPLSAYLGLI